MRRIITGHNAEGKSVVMHEGPPARSIGEDVGGLYEIWNTESVPFTTKGFEDKAEIDIELEPSKGGTKFRYFQINPTPEGIPIKILNEMAADAFDKINASHCRVDVSRHPAMHKTDSIDYIILLKGDVTLILDEDEIDLKPFDTVVQRGTNHAWRNNGNEPALFIAVLIDSEIDA